MVCIWIPNKFVEVMYVDEAEEWAKNWSMGNSCQNFFDAEHMIFCADRLFFYLGQGRIIYLPCL